LKGNLQRPGYKKEEGNTNNEDEIKEDIKDSSNKVEVEEKEEGEEELLKSLVFEGSDEGGEQ